MALGTGIGQARALLRRGGEDWWMKRLAADMQAAKIEKAKQKAKQQEELTSILDFKIDYGKYLPAWGREVAGVYADFINDVATMRQQDPNISPLSVQVRAQEAKRRIGELEAQNNMARKYLEDKDIMRNEAFDKELVSFDSTFETLNQVSNPGFYHVSPRGGFNYRQVPAKQRTFDWGAKVSEGKPTVEGGLYKIEMQYAGGKEDQMVADGLNDPIYRLQTAWNLSESNKDYQMKDGETDFEYMERIAPVVDVDIANVVRSQAEGAVYKYENIPSRGGSGGGGAKKQNYAVSDESVGYYVPGKGLVNDTWKAKPTPAKQSIPLRSDGSFMVLDQNKNEYIKRGTAVNFRPLRTVIMNVKGKGYQMYVEGMLTKDVGEDAQASDLMEILGAQGTDQQTAEKYKNVYNILVPYQGSVKSIIDGNNDMTDILGLYDGMKGKASASTKDGTYTKAQEQGIQNVMSKNNISRQEAIDALKAAGKL